MKKLALMVSTLFLAVACTNEPTPSTQFIRQDILGEWTLSQVAYSGEMPNPLNPSALVQFSGLGTQLIGSVNIYEMPDTGNIDIAFVADLNSIQVPVSLKSSGSWPAHPRQSAWLAATCIWPPSRPRTRETLSP